MLSFLDNSMPINRIDPVDVTNKVHNSIFLNERLLPLAPKQNNLGIKNKDRINQSLPELPNQMSNKMRGFIPLEQRLRVDLYYWLWGLGGWF